VDQVIYLDKDDDITAIRDRLEWAKARRVLLVSPRGVKTLRSLVQLKVLARLADDLAIELGVATPDLRVRDLAREAKLRTFAGERSARLAGWVRRGAAVARPVDTTAPQLIEPGEPTPPPRIRVQDRRLVVVVGSGRVGLIRQVGALLLLLLLGLSLVAGFLAFAPQATVTLTPRLQPVLVSTIVLADPTIEVVDSARGIIPARLVQDEVRKFGAVPTIETEETPAEYAQGTVIFINRTNEEQIVPISTTVSSSAGRTISFITTVTATLAAGTGVTTPTTVVALEPGSVGNVATAQINRLEDPVLRLRVGVINEIALTGGTERRAGIVTEADKDRLRAVLLQEVQQIGYENLQVDLTPGEFIPPESIEVIVLDVTYNRFSGDFAIDLGGEIYAVVRGTVVNGFYANQLAYAALQDDVPLGYVLSLDALQFRAGGLTDVTNRAVTFPVFAEGVAVADFEERKIARQIRAMPIGQAQALLGEQWPLDGVPGIDVEPNWLGRLPFFGFRIRVVVREPELNLARERT
jgi:hypothetical protein